MKLLKYLVGYAAAIGLSVALLMPEQEIPESQGETATEVAETMTDSGLGGVALAAAPASIDIPEALEVFVAAPAPAALTATIAGPGLATLGAAPQPETEICAIWMMRNVYAQLTGLSVSERQRDTIPVPAPIWMLNKLSQLTNGSAG